jgi:hypothetical protein
MIVSRGRWHRPELDAPSDLVSITSATEPASKNAPTRADRNVTQQTQLPGHRVSKVR